MRVLLIHQNFPGQFRQLLPLLKADGHDLRAICSHHRPLPDDILVQRYAEPDLSPLASFDAPGLPFWAEALSRAPQVAQLANQLRLEGWSPDLILGHSGWGETLLLKNVWPKVPIVIWPELWVQPKHAGIIMSPSGFGPSLHQLADHTARNHLTSAALSSASAWVLPTQYQADSFPTNYQNERLHVIHEGINTRLASPRQDASYIVRGIKIDRTVPTITFVNRNLERLRGFDVFMRALPQILRANSKVRVLIIGDNGGGYAVGAEQGPPLKQRMLEELEGELDLERIHFLGRVPYEALLIILQASWVHIYLTKPFILGWSLLEAMSCGCTIVGSEGMPVAEVLRHGHNSLLVPIHSHEELARAVADLLANSSLRCLLGENARRDALKWDQKMMWPRFKGLFEQVIAAD